MVWCSSSAKRKVCWETLLDENRSNNFHARQPPCKQSHNAFFSLSLTHDTHNFSLEHNLVLNSKSSVAHRADRHTHAAARRVIKIYSLAISVGAYFTLVCGFILGEQIKNRPLVHAQRDVDFNHILKPENLCTKCLNKLCIIYNSINIKGENYALIVVCYFWGL